MASIICQALGRGVTRSQRRAIQWTRKAAENGVADACLRLAGRMEEAAGVATSAGVMEGHDVPPDVLTSVVQLRKGADESLAMLDKFRRLALEGSQYCHNDGCEVVGHLKDFQVCPQCKYTRYCGDACQKEDWTTGGHINK